MTKVRRRTNRGATRPGTTTTPHTKARRAPLVALAAAGLALAATGSAGAAPHPSAGPVSTKIVGGQPAGTSQYPWVVYLTDSAGNQFCGGTLAAADKVVTAAHCASGSAPQDVTVVAGRDDKTGTAGDEVRVTGKWVHPRFQDATTGADVAVLTLERELPQTPLQLASPEDSGLYQAGNQATILGWGSTEEGGEPSNTLQRAQVPISTDQQCSKAYQSSYKPEAMVCAGLPEGGVDACQGDSGGPLVAGDRLIGITSWGNGCARPGQPGVYTRVSTYFEDVQQQLQ